MTTDRSMTSQPLTAEEIEALQERWQGAPENVLVMRLLATLVAANPAPAGRRYRSGDLQWAYEQGVAELPRCEHGAVREPCIPCSDAANPAPAGLDVERLADALMAAGFEQSAAFADKVAAEYARLGA